MIRVVAEKDFYLFNGKQYSGTDALGRICREIGSEGFLEVYRGDVLCLTVDICKRKVLSLREGDKEGFRYVDYKPFSLSR